MKPSTRPNNSNGMASVMAIVVIGLLAAVLTATAARAVIEQRRAAAMGVEAQASRLLAAASQVARQQLIDTKTADGAIETPLGQATLGWRNGNSAARSCEVIVQLGSVKRAATLSFADGKLVRVE